jgi:hypothetical protein
MTIEKNFIDTVQNRQAHETWQQFKRSSPTEQELTIKLMSIRIQQLNRELEGMTNLAIQAQKLAQMATAKNIGMPQDMIDQYLGGQ